MRLVNTRGVMKPVGSFGLKIVNRIAEIHGGRMEMSKLTTGGTTVRLAFRGWCNFCSASPGSFSTRPLSKGTSAALEEKPQSIMRGASGGRRHARQSNPYPDGHAPRYCRA